MFRNPKRNNWTMTPWRASPSLHPCPTRRLDRKAPLVTMFTSCVCIRGNPERFAGRRGGFGCSSDAARHALDRGSCGTSLEKREFLRGISYLAPFCFPVAQIPSWHTTDMSCSHSVFFRLPLEISLCLQQEAKPRPKSLSCASTLLCVSPISTGAPNGSPLLLYLSDAMIKGPLFIIFYF